MTDDEARPWVGKSVMVQLDDGRVVGCTLQAEGGDSNHPHYTLVSAPAEDGQPVTEVVHGAGQIRFISDSSS